MINETSPAKQTGLPQLPVGLVCSRFMLLSLRGIQRRTVQPVSRLHDAA